MTLFDADARPASSQTGGRVSKASRRTRLPGGWFSKTGRLGGLVNHHPLLSVFLVALFVRVAIAALIALAGLMHEVAPDAATYIRLAAEKATGDTGEWEVREHSRYSRFAAFVVPLTWLFRVFGTHAVFGQLFAALAGAVAATAVCAIGLRFLERGWAVLAGTLVALLPSQILWSSVALRDAPVWAGTSVMALLVALSFGARGLRLLTLGLGVALTGVYLGNLRDPSMVVVMWALVIAMFVARRPGYWFRIAGAIAIAALIPMLTGAGFFGRDVPPREIPSESRAAEARGATAIYESAELEDGEGGGAADATAGDSVSADNSVSAGASASRSGSDLEGDPTDDTPLLSLSDLGYIPTGLRVMLLEPLPWTEFEGRYVGVAQLETIIWYPVLALAGVGLFEALRRRIAVLAFPVIAGAGLLLGFALAEGNFGTAFRHRGEFVYVVALLAALGARTVWRWYQARRSRSIPGSAREDAQEGSASAEWSDARVPSAAYNAS